MSWCSTESLAETASDSAPTPESHGYSAGPGKMTVGTAQGGKGAGWKGWILLVKAHARSYP